MSAEVRQLAELLQAPVASYRTGRGVLDSRHYLSVVQPQAHPLWKDVDVALVIGSNMRIPLRDWGVDEDLAVIRIDVDPASHTRYVTPAVAITARAEDALPALIARLVAAGGSRPSRRDEMHALGEQWKTTRAFSPADRVPGAHSPRARRDGILVDELTQVGFSRRGADARLQTSNVHLDRVSGTLGYGFQTALGVKVARPDVPVISVTGDGGFMFGVQELATAVQHGIALITIVFNNNQYGNVQQMQRTLYGNRIIASDLRNPDFARLAESFGARGLRAETPDALGRALQDSLTASEPTLIEVPCGDMPDVDLFRKLPRVAANRLRA